MKKIIKELFYRYKLFAYSFMYSEDSNYTKLLEECLKYGIKSIESKSSTDDVLRVIFKNNISYSFVNVNKFYGWLSSGFFVLENGKVFYFRCSRPSVESMYKFNILIEKYKENHIISEIQRNFKNLKGV